MDELAVLRAKICEWHRAPEEEVLRGLTAEAAIDPETRARISASAEDLVIRLRETSDPGLMEVFLEEYGLSTDEGVALMCLAEALLRVPDADTMDALIEDKIAPSSWGEHLGKSSSSLVNASTWALMLTGRVLDDENSKGLAGVLHGAVRRLGEPVIRAAVMRAMKELGAQFVLGQTIEEAMARGATPEEKGFTYSYDMLGEAALTQKDADGYFQKYKDAISAIGKAAPSADIRDNPGISIKLSALHPRYEMPQKDRVLKELVPLVIELCLSAKANRIGLNIDAEEAARIDLSLDVIEAVFADDRLLGWDGFGVVVQAYGKRAMRVIDWLYALASRHDRKIMVRLVKGAYWDSEIKIAQIDGVEDFPVFTAKAATDVSYICCAKKLLKLTDRIYPQFATHNAHTISAVLEIADDKNAFEFQRLHGMGEAIHKIAKELNDTRCRIYAPVGVHRDLLAYLVRRLLENGANSSFVNQVVDEHVPPSIIASDPFKSLESCLVGCGPGVVPPTDIFGPTRRNSKGWDISNSDDLEAIHRARNPFRQNQWLFEETFKAQSVNSPQTPKDVVGVIREFTASEATEAIAGVSRWDMVSVTERADILRKAADLYETHHGEIFALLAREAGKILPDAIAELREAVDFLRFYACEAERRGERTPAGIFTCISPWNFPLAIFSGQIAAALAAGNGVLAKPAETTPLIASLAVSLFYEAGVPETALKLVLGEGSTVGAALTSDPRIDGVCFTGSTATAQLIHRAMADTMSPGAPLIAETGGLNAMIVDSTALPEQAVSDIIASAFQSAGQRCSALRVLYIQEDVAETFLEMLAGAMDELRLGDPWDLSTDIGPVIDEPARLKIDRHIAAARRGGRVLKEISRPRHGLFVGPTLIRIGGISDLKEEIFGPVLHVATFKAQRLDQVAEEINKTGYGLTFGLHTRIDDRVEDLTQIIQAGNIYVNRNQIGAIVGSQPFGGEGLSGTGPKAGGPYYLDRFYASKSPTGVNVATGAHIELDDLQRTIDSLPENRRKPISAEELPGPTGESNRLSIRPRGTVLCLGPGFDVAREQAEIARSVGCGALVVADGARNDGQIDGQILAELLTDMEGIDVVVWWGDEGEGRIYRKALAARPGPIVPLVTGSNLSDYCIQEQHICIDTTAAGGNASLLAGVDVSLSADDQKPRLESIDLEPV
ncbi:MAG: bifunctional proline dehydrogenase/L-glutamate gamma-semialdehyde dehydrogenase PutA [Pseudomonadota bacterium]